MLNSLNECIQVNLNLLSFRPFFPSMLLSDCRAVPFGLQNVGTLIESGHVKAMVDEFKQVLIASNTRKKERSDRRQSEDFDAEESELLQEENEQEEEIFDQACERMFLYLSEAFTFNTFLNIILHIPTYTDRGMHWITLENIQRNLSSFS